MRTMLEISIRFKHVYDENITTPFQFLIMIMEHINYIGNIYNYDYFCDIHCISILIKILHI